MVRLDVISYKYTTRLSATTAIYRRTTRPLYSAPTTTRVYRSVGVAKSASDEKQYSQECVTVICITDTTHNRATQFAGFIYTQITWSSSVEFFEMYLYIHYKNSSTTDISFKNASFSYRKHEDLFTSFMRIHHEIHQFRNTVCLKCVRNVPDTHMIDRRKAAQWNNIIKI